MPLLSPQPSSRLPFPPALPCPAEIVILLKTQAPAQGSAPPALDVRTRAAFGTAPGARQRAELFRAALASGELTWWAYSFPGATASAIEVTGGQEAASAAAVADASPSPSPSPPPAPAGQHTLAFTASLPVQDPGNFSTDYYVKTVVSETGYQLTQMVQGAPTPALHLQGPCRACLRVYFGGQASEVVGGCESLAAAPAGKASCL